MPRCFVFQLPDDLTPTYLQREETMKQTERQWWIKTLAMIPPVVLIIAVIVVNHHVGSKRSDREIHRLADSLAPVYYLDKRPFSGQLYGQGKAKSLTSEMIPQLHQQPRFQLIGDTQTTDRFIADEGFVV